MTCCSSYFTNIDVNVTVNLNGRIFKVHSVRSVHIRSFSGPYFPTFRLNMEKYFVSLRIQSECGKIRTSETPNTDTFHAVVVVTCGFREARKFSVVLTIVLVILR